MCGRTQALFRLLAIATAIAFIAGCAQTQERTAESDDSQTSAMTTASVGAAPMDSYAWLAALLPSDAELTAAAGYQVRMEERPSVHSRLRNTAAGSRELTQKQCLGVVSPLEQQVYGDAAVRAATFATESSVTFGVVAMDSLDDARRVFDTFSKQWQDCRGQTLVKADGVYTYEHRITTVEATADVVSALDEVTSNSPTGVPVRNQRALGVAKDCIVEVSVPITDPRPGDPPSTTNAAADLVNAMLVRIRAARP